MDNAIGTAAFMMFRDKECLISNPMGVGEPLVVPTRISSNDLGTTACVEINETNTKNETNISILMCEC
jgi:hypothetical protein